MGHPPLRGPRRGERSPLGGATIVAHMMLPYYLPFDQTCPWQTNSVWVISCLAEQLIDLGIILSVVMREDALFTLPANFGALRLYLLRRAPASLAHPKMGCIFHNIP